MKKIILLILLLMPIVVYGENNKLYDVLKNEVESGGVAKEYTGEHQDTVDGSGKSKIYYFNATSNETADEIINKRNVLFGGFCWEMFRTTDSGGVKLLFNGPPSSGKCPGVGQTIGNSNYTVYDNISSIGSVGYMYNKLYPYYTSDYPNYGSYVVNGQKLNEADYNIISITKFQDYVPSNNSYPYKNSFSFTSKGWQNEKSTEGYSRSGTITFNVINDGDYILDYNFDYDFYSDRVDIYKNDERINSIVRQEKGNVVLNDLKSTDVIKVDLDLMSRNDNHADFYFNLKIPTSTPVDTRAYFGNSVSYENGRYTLIDTIRSDGTENLAYNHYFCKDGSTSCEDVYYTMMWYYPKQMQSFKLSGGMKIEEFVNDQLYAEDVNKYDSALKQTIDNWYEHALINYSNYLEDTVFCQDRTMAYEENGLNPNGGNPTGGNRKTLFYKQSSYDEVERQKSYLYNSNLKCKNETDRFSVANEKAKLKYSVATINFAEALLLFEQEYNQNSVYGQKVRAHRLDSSYWLLSPHDMLVTYGWSVSGDGGIYYSYGSNSNAVRPVVSLKHEIEYESGDGSKDNPYVIKNYTWNKIETDSSNGKIEFNIKDTDEVMETIKVKFNIQPDEDYLINKIEIKDIDGEDIEYISTDTLNGYEFIMPNKAVNIKVTYKKDDKKYKFIEGMGQSFDVINDSRLKFCVNMKYDDFIKDGNLYIDKEIVDKKYYELSKDSSSEYLIIIFNDEYSKNLIVGNHEIVAQLSNGKMAATNFNINENLFKNPKTSDKILILIILLLISFSSLLFYKKVRHSV